MNNNIADIYNKLIDNGISITDLYIYDAIINNDTYYYEPNKNIMDTIYSIKENYANDYEGKSLDYHINYVLNGNEAEDDEWD